MHEKSLPDVTKYVESALNEALRAGDLCFSNFVISSKSLSLNLYTYIPPVTITARCCPLGEISI